MPAILPARLKVKVNQLVEKITQPEEFINALKEILDYYSDRVRKPGRILSQTSLMDSFQVPKQVARQIETRLSKKLTGEPEIALALADYLWREDWLECRILALQILGWVPPDPPQKILDRLVCWGKQRGEDHVLDGVFAEGLTGLWKETPEIFFDLIESWLKSSQVKDQKLGLRIIPLLVRNKDFQNLPKILSLLTPFVEQVGVIPNPDLVSSLRELAKRSPKETAYFLHRNMAISENKQINGLIRQIINEFPSTIRDDLRVILHGS